MIPATDRLVFAAVNVLAYLLHPRFVRLFRRQQGYWPNLATPRGLAELVQWRKLFDRNPDFVIFADKLATKRWAAERAPEISSPETLWVGRRAEDLPAELITPDNVVKLNTGVNYNYFPHRSGTDRDAMVRRVRRWISTPLGRWLRRFRHARGEWAYVRVPVRVLVERRVVPLAGHRLVDISVRVFDGQVHSLYCATDFKQENSRLSYFWPDGTRFAENDSDFQGLPSDFVLPAATPQAIAIASRLGAGHDYLRVDFMTGGEQLYMGEVTMYPASGYGVEGPRAKATYQVWLTTLHRAWFLTTPQPWPLSIYAAAFRRWLADQQSRPSPVPSAAPALRGPAR